MSHALLAQLSKHFTLHQCLRESDFLTTPGHPIKYIHHFFPDPNKLTWSEDFRVELYYIPTTFDIYVKCKGPIIRHDCPKTADLRASHEWVTETLEKAQPFPGGFMRKESDFRARLRALTQTAATPVAKKAKTETADGKSTGGLIECAKDVVDAKLRLNLTATPCARIEHAFEDEGSDLLWLLEVAVATSNEEEVSTDSGPGLPRPFGFVHRRLEWLMHFHIDAMSDIELDPRWRVFLPIRFFTKPDPLECTRLAIQRSENEKEKTSRGGKRTALDSSVESVAGKLYSEWPLLHLQSIDHLMIALAGESQEVLLESGPAMTALLEEGHEAFEILGIVTLFQVNTDQTVSRRNVSFQFFSLPRDRARLSQFFVLPHRQRTGIGREVLSAIVELVCADSSIREFSVEDPAPAFQRLRDTVGIELALHKGLLRRECLYPLQEVQEAQKRGVKDLKLITDEIAPTHPDEWPRYSAVLRTLQKEAASQRRRLKLLLVLARVMPTSILEEFVGRPSVDAAAFIAKSAKKDTEPKDTDSKGAGTPTDYKQLIEWQRESSVLKKIRVTEKRRFRLESLEWYDNQRSLPETQAELEAEWIQLFVSLCGSIKVIRRLYPLA